ATSPAAERPPSRPNSTALPATGLPSVSIAFSTCRQTRPSWPPAPSKIPPPVPQDVDITRFVSGLNPTDILRYKTMVGTARRRSYTRFVTYGIDHPQRRTEKNRSRQLLRRQLPPIFRLVRRSPPRRQ